MNPFSNAGNHQTKGSRKNNLAILGVEAPAWKGVNSPEYLDISKFCNANGREASAFRMVRYFWAIATNF
jgi:hypothetical protein